MKKGLVSSIVVLICVFIMGICANADTVNERSWYFKDAEFEALSGHNENEPITINGLTIGKGCQNNEYKGHVKVFFFERSIYTMANGNRDEGYIKFSVSGDTDIHILGVSKSRTENRVLSIYSTSNKVTGSLTITPNTEDYIYKYRGSASDIYLYTAGGGVRIYGITAKNYNSSESEYPPLGEEEKNVWDIKDYSSYAGEITQDINLNGMNIKATTSYPVKLEGMYSSHEPYGYEKDWYVNLMGVSKNESRQMSFPVNKNSDVYITARAADGESTRKLVIWNRYYGTPNTNLGGDILNIGTNIETYKISYYGDGEVFNICSQDSGIKIYKISVVPRVNKVINYKKWDISANNSFSTGSYTNSTIDGLNIINATVENSAATGNQKAIHIKSKPYNDAEGGMLKFDLSDSSRPRGTAVKRTINIKAKSAYDEEMKLILINSDDYIIGATNLTTDIKEYKFDYTGTYDSIYVYSYYPNNRKSAGAYIYSIDNGIKIAECPEDYSRTVSVTKGQKYQYYFTAGNIDADAFTYKISYNKDALIPKYIGYGDGNDNYSTDGINIIKKENGEIIYTIENKNSNWSGVTVSVIFEAKSGGNTTIGFIAEPII